jgi:hypothetical protein
VNDPFELADTLDATLDDALAGFDIQLPPDKDGLEERLRQVLNAQGRTSPGDDGVNVLELWAWVTGAVHAPGLAAQFWTGLDDALGPEWPGAAIGFEESFAKALRAADGDLLRALLALMDACRPAARLGRPARALAFGDLGADPAQTLGWAALAWVGRIKGAQSLAEDALAAEPSYLGAGGQAAALAAVLLAVGGAGLQAALDAVEAFTEARLRTLADPAARAQAIGQKLATVASPPSPPAEPALKLGLALAKALAAAGERESGV